jgi:hypothetical protein
MYCSAKVFSKEIRRYVAGERLAERLCYRDGYNSQQAGSRRNSATPAQREAYSLRQHNWSSFFTFSLVWKD